ncbi:hypothetical protein SAMN04489761_0121 [Tenacibaculum sp. MAR_2009_124]|uniref:hypothetical protein n=1 Tax=Tenacibaculum sp. MAR_2009_124 TaxID=1250059 RepID=UPI00089A171F|nr:hypothetical protein [Tenacibaculum sp. MAR_2009_124]SEB36094.1 hypothetical protein SAMN04489761_0121 [Tenacibaculum sp. MAR_2009_124]
MKTKLMFSCFITALLISCNSNEELPIEQPSLTVEVLDKGVPLESAEVTLYLRKNLYPLDEAKPVATGITDESGKIIFNKNIEKHQKYTAKVEHTSECKNNLFFLNNYFTDESSKTVLGNRYKEQNILTVNVLKSANIMLRNTSPGLTGFTDNLHISIRNNGNGRSSLGYLVPNKTLLINDFPIEDKHLMEIVHIRTGEEISSDHILTGNCSSTTTYNLHR